MTERLTLLDLRRKSEVVPISTGQELEVRGISAKDIGILLERFQELQKLFVGLALTPVEFAQAFPEITGAGIAAACDLMGNEQAEEIAATLPLGDQADLLEAIGRCTFSNGFGPFKEKFLAFKGALSVEVGRAPGMRSPMPSPTSQGQSAKTPGPSPPGSSQPTPS